MKGHKWFAAAYDRMMAPVERKYTAAVRRELLGDLSGAVLEVGAGTGLNFQYYPAAARVTAVEPDPYMLERARKRAASAAASIELLQAPAESLPLPDSSFDYAVSTLVFCSVNDPRRALAEVRRVLKPGGELRVYEHVRARSTAGGLAQDVISPFWQWVGAGCHPNRDTGRYLKEAGFEIVRSERRRTTLLPPMVVVTPHLLAVARKPA